MAYKLRYIGLGVVMAAIAVTAFSFVFFAKANPLFFLRQNNGTTTTATTSVAYMTAGNATTTYYFDAGAVGSQAADNATFTAIFIGSSTASTLNISLEYAMPEAGFDCIANPSACEWMGDDILGIPNSTTTNSISLGQTTKYTLAFASTTVGGAGGNGNGRITRIFTIPTPTRYVRAVLTLPGGSLNGAVWGEFVGQRQAY